MITKGLRCELSRSMMHQGSRGAHIRGSIRRQVSPRLSGAHLGRDGGRGDGPVGGLGRARGRPQDAVGLHAQVAGKEARLAVACMSLTLQAQNLPEAVRM